MNFFMERNLNSYFIEIFFYLIVYNFFSIMLEDKKKLWLQIKLCEIGFGTSNLELISSRNGVKGKHLKQNILWKIPKAMQNMSFNKHFSQDKIFKVFLILFSCIKIPLNFCRFLLKTHMKTFQTYRILFLFKSKILNLSNYVYLYTYKYLLTSYTMNTNKFSL